MAKTITGSFVLSSGNPIANGTLYLQLSQPAVATATGAQVSNRLIAIALDVNGSIPAGTIILANDELAPSTFYRATVNLNGGGRAYGPEPVTLTGASPITLNFTPSIPVG